MSPRAFRPSLSAQILCLAFVLIVAPGCGSSATSSPEGEGAGAGGQGGAPGGEGGTMGGGGCVVPSEEPPGTLTITIDNHRSTPVYYEDGRGDWELCAVPFDITFPSVPDGQVSPWADTLADPEDCKSAVDCNPGKVFEVGPGESVELSWDGLLDVDADADDCFCLEEVAPELNDTGAITLNLYDQCTGGYGETCSGAFSLSDSFVYAPSASVTFDVMP